MPCLSNQLLLCVYQNGGFPERMVNRVCGSFLGIGPLKTVPFKPPKTQAPAPKRDEPSQIDLGSRLPLTWDLPRVPRPGRVSSWPSKMSRCCRFRRSSRTSGLSEPLYFKLIGFSSRMCRLPQNSLPFSLFCFFGVPLFSTNQAKSIFFCWGPNSSLVERQVF